MVFSTEPSRHVFLTLIGLGIGYKLHQFEENSAELYKEMIKKHKNAPWYEKGVLLAEREARQRALESGDVDDADLGGISTLLVICQKICVK